MGVFYFQSVLEAFFFWWDECWIDIGDDDTGRLFVVVVNDGGVLRWVFVRTSGWNEDFFGRGVKGLFKNRLFGPIVVGRGDGVAKDVAAAYMDLFFAVYIDVDDVLVGEGALGKGDVTALPIEGT